MGKRRYRIAAIPTVYRGTKFKSRLEARWARFFDYMGVPWNYESHILEKNGYPYYLPDFRVLLNGTWNWIEIKPSKPLYQEREKASILANESGRNVAIFFGSFNHRATVKNLPKGILFRPGNTGRDDNKLVHLQLINRGRIGILLDIVEATAKWEFR